VKFVPEITYFISELLIPVLGDWAEKLIVTRESQAKYVEFDAGFNPVKTYP
jgi:hypothetical protein